MSSEYEPVSLVLVERLAKHLYAGWWSDLTIAQVLATAPITEHMDPFLREMEYDIGRAHHFILELRACKMLDPIEVDQYWHNGTPLRPVINDGYHRLVAHLLNGQRLIRASCSGTMDMIDWLTGRSGNDPMDSL